MALDLSQFRDPKLARELIDTIHALTPDRPVSIMEVCGTHTVAIARNGIRSAMPENVRLISGPGCPVCVTANRDIDAVQFIHKSMHGILIRNVQPAERQASSSGEVFRSFGGASGNARHFAALKGEPAGDGPAYAGGCACDEHSFTVDIFHKIPYPMLFTRPMET